MSTHEKTLKLVTVFNTDPNGDFGAVWQAGAAPSVAANGDLIFSTGNGTFDAFTTTTPPGPAAQGEGGFGLGYGGIHQSVAVSFAASIPSTGVSSTGLFHNGVYPTDKPVAPDVFQPLKGTGIDFTTGSEDPNGPHTFQATLSYHGTTLTETITDQTTGASFSRDYANVDLPTTVGGSTAFVGFGGSTDGRHGTMAITSWTYSSGGQTLIDHSGGFASTYPKVCTSRSGPTRMRSSSCFGRRSGGRSGSSPPSRRTRTPTTSRATGGSRSSTVSRCASTEPPRRRFRMSSSRTGRRSSSATSSCAPSTRRATGPSTAASLSSTARAPMSPGSSSPAIRSSSATRPGPTSPSRRRRAPRDSSTRSAGSSSSATASRSSRATSPDRSAARR